MNKMQRCCVLSFFFQILFFLLLMPVFALPFGGKIFLTNGQADGEDGNMQHAVAVKTSDEEKGGIRLAAGQTKVSSIGTGNNEALIRAEIEKGTPTSLRSAVSRIRQQGINMSDSNKLLVYVASTLYKTVYPDERLNWDIPEIKDSSIYYNQIESAKMGAYTFGYNKSSDFLTLVLPSLVMFTAPELKNYFSDAEIALTNAVKLNGNSLLGHFLLGTLYGKEEKYDLAVKELETAFKIQSDCVSIAAPYIEMLIKVGKHKDAYNAAVKVLLKNTANARMLQLCGESAFAMKDWNLAEQYIEQVLQKDSMNARFQLLRSRILLEKGDFLRASASLDSYSRIEKPDKDFYIVKVRLLRDWNKNMQSASTTVTDALKIYPDDNEIMLLAASVASVTGTKINGLSASQLSSKILSYDPDNVEALSIMVKEALKNEQWQTAYERSTRLIRVSDSEEAKLLRIDACLGANALSEAQDIAKGLYRDNSDVESVQQMYIKVLIASNGGGEALSLIEQLLPSASQKAKSVLYYLRSRLASNSAAKMNDLRNSLTSNPRNEDALYDLYEYYYQKKDYRKALYYLKQVIALKPSDAKLLKQQTELDKLLAQ